VKALAGEGDDPENDHYRVAGYIFRLFFFIDTILDSIYKNDPWFFLNRLETGLPVVFLS